MSDTAIASLVMQAIVIEKKFQDMDRALASLPPPVKETGAGVAVVDAMGGAAPWPSSESAAAAAQSKEAAAFFVQERGGGSSSNHLDNNNNDNSNLSREICRSIIKAYVRYTGIQFQ